MIQHLTKRNNKRSIYQIIAFIYILNLFSHTLFIVIR